MRIAVVDAATTRPLRRAVLRPSWPADAVMHGDQFPDAVHFAALDEDGVVRSACLVLPRPYPRRPDEPGAWQLRGMATDEAFRGRGLGAELLAATVAHVAQLSAHIVWCEARVSAVSFYARHGFTVDGPQFLHAETGIPHHYMWRAIAQ
jgi:predicted GNAT family N-acyltransferase